MAVLSISSGQLGILLQKTYNESVVFQGSEDIKDFELLLSRKVGSPQGENQEFLMHGSLGMAGVQWSSPGSISNYPEAQSAKLSRKIANFKEINSTVSVQKSVWDAAMRSPSNRYLEPLVLEAQSKALAHKKRLAMALHGDGTGVLGQVLSAAVVAGNLEITLDSSNSARGFVGWFQEEDILILRAASGGASAIDSNLAIEPVFYQVVDRQRQLNKVVLRPLDAAKAPIAGLASLTISPAVGEVFYTFAQPTIPDLTAAIVDYANASEVMAGFESLCAFDGRVVHGVNMSGATAGTRVNASGATIDSSHIQSVMSQVKNRVGGGRYKYDSVLCAREVYDTFINAGETDRRFMVADDVKRGSRKFVYVHESDTLEIRTSEYIPKNRIRVMPAVADKKGTMELRMTEFEKVSIDGVSSHLGVNAGGHTKLVNQYMTGYGVLINLHPAACGTIDNFVL